MKKITGVYILKDVKTGQFYVGSSNDVHKRVTSHFANLRRNKHHSVKLLNVWNKGNGLSVTIFPTSTREEAYELEQDFIDRFIGSELMLNVCLGVRGGDNLTMNPNREDIVRRIKNSVVERMSVLSSYDKKLLFSKPGSKNGMYGKTHSEEARKKMSEVNKGNKYCLGLKRSEDQRRKMSELAKKRVGSLNPFFGRSHSEKTKKILAEKNKGTLPPNCKKVSVKGEVFISAKEASRKLGICASLLTYRVRSGKQKYSDYFYID